MDVVADLVAPCRPDELFAWVDDLDRYPRWLEILDRSRRLDSVSPGEAAWSVDLRGRIGPLSRSKRLRMVRTRHDSPKAVTFERQETDGRQHSPWRLRAEVEPVPEGASLHMTLHYGGSLFGPVLERVLREEIERSKPRLLSLVS
jgi:Polyketide cyclase / dehydrase and lipid transport